mmetsp:Transcript_55850/g.76233  ORF Transcript_55850/g.76233 Transcript_55850/m.76233 type:complete len:81 (-) Transcript_55850:618-860(-)
MQNHNGMVDESQNQLARRIEAAVKVLEAATDKRIWEVKVTQDGDLNATMDDLRYLHENPRPFVDPDSVAGFNDSNNLHEF